MAISRSEAQDVGGLQNVGGALNATEEPSVRTRATHEPKRREAMPDRMDDGRFSVVGAKKRFWTKFQKDLSGKSLKQEELRQISVDAVDTPVTGKHPEGMFGRLFMLNTVTKHIEDYATVVSICPYEQYRDAEGVHKKAYTQMNIHFKNGLLCNEHIRSVDVLRFLYHSDRYGIDWTIDMDDPGGFWEMVGLIKTVRQPVKVLTEQEG